MLDIGGEDSDPAAQAVFYLLSKVLDTLLSPYTWGLGLVILATPFRRPKPGCYRRRRALGIAGIAILLVFSFEPVSAGMFHRLEHATTSTYRPDVVYDAVILLGGVSDERVVAETGQSAYNDNVDRLVQTHRLLSEGHARSAIISAAPVDPAFLESGEARVLARQLAAWGIEPARIVLEEQARNTHENAVYSKRLAEERGFKNVLVVTSAFHMRRSIECFNAVGMKVDTLAVDYRTHGGPRSYLPRAGFLSESTGTIREVVGLYIYRARGYAKEKLNGPRSE